MTDQHGEAGTGVLAELQAARAVAIVRGNYTLTVIRAMATALLDGGVRAVEMTMNSAGALDAMRLMQDEFGDRLIVGAGTVLEPSQVAQVAAAGVRFIVSPETNPDVVRAAHDAGLLIAPGAFTPTEIMAAHRLGARMIKLFPAATGGPDYLRYVRGPLDFVKFVVTGGITIDNARSYLDAGAIAVGLTDVLVSKTFSGSANDAAELTRRARRLAASFEASSALRHA